MENTVPLRPPVTAKDLIYGKNFQPLPPHACPHSLQPMATIIEAGRRNKGRFRTIQKLSRSIRNQILLVDGGLSDG